MHMIEGWEAFFELSSRNHFRNLLDLVLQDGEHCYCIWFICKTIHIFNSHSSHHLIHWEKLWGVFLHLPQVRLLWELWSRKEANTDLICVCWWYTIHKFPSHTLSLLSIPRSPTQHQFSSQRSNAVHHIPDRCVLFILLYLYKKCSVVTLQNGWLCNLTSQVKRTQHVFWPIFTQ